MAADTVIVRVGTLDTQGTSSSTYATACGRPAPLVGATVFGVTAPAVTETRDPRRSWAKDARLGHGHRGTAPRAPRRAPALMVGGQIAAERSATEPQDDPDAQRRFLGVEPIATEE